MARTPTKASTTAGRNTTAAPQPQTTPDGPLDKQDGRTEDRQPSDNRNDNGSDNRSDNLGRNERREGLTAVHDDRRTDSRENDDAREDTDRFDDRRSDENREQPAMAAGMDTFTPVLEAWKQVFRSWSELTETMVKVQRDAFASMMGAADIHARNITLNDRRTTDRTDGADRTVWSSATASTPDRIEGNRR
jgi:hypothetical protein